MNGERYESIKFSSVHDLTVKLIVFLIITGCIIYMMLLLSSPHYWHTAGNSKNDIPQCHDNVHESVMSFPLFNIFTYKYAISWSVKFF